MQNRGVMADKVIISLIYAYLSLPILMLFFGWFRWYVALPCALMLMTGLVISVRSGFEYAAPASDIFSKYKWAIAVVALFLLVLTSGIGGIFYQNWDFHSRNAIFHDLINLQWPVKYDYQGDVALSAAIGKMGMMDYYFASWLPAAMLGKVFGWDGANISQLIWTFLGILGAFYLYVRKIGKIGLWAIFIFIFWSGLDYVGQIIFRVNSYSSLQSFMKTLPTVHMEWWASHFQYSSFVTQLFYVFNQAVPAWLVTYLILNQKNLKVIVFTAFLLVPYGPLPFIGTSLLLTFAVFFGIDNLNLRFGARISIKKVAGNIKSVFTYTNTLLILPMLPLMQFFLINQGGQPKGFITDKIPKDFEGLKSFLLHLLLFCFFEFGLAALLLKKWCNKKLLAFVCIVLTLIPLYYVGLYNDFVMRASIPLLCILSLMTASVMSDLMGSLQWRRKKSVVEIESILMPAMPQGAGSEPEENLQSSVEEIGQEEYMAQESLHVPDQLLQEGDELSQPICCEKLQEEPFIQEMQSTSEECMPEICEEEPMPVIVYKKSYRIALALGLAAFILVAALTGTAEIHRSLDNSKGKLFVEDKLVADAWKTFLTSEEEGDGQRKQNIKSYVAKYEENNFIFRFIMK